MKTEPAATRPHETPHVPSRDEVRQSLRLYFIVGMILFCGTLATVAVATIPALDVGEHGFDKWDALLGIAIAGTKATLVAAVFMHLNHERRLIYGVIGLAGIHAVGCFLGTYLHYVDPAHDLYFYNATGSHNTGSGNKSLPGPDSATQPPASTQVDNPEPPKP